MKIFWKTQNDLKPMSLMSFILSFVSLIVVSLLLFFPTTDETKTVLIIIDTCCCFLFLLQLTIDFCRSNNRRQFFIVHTIDIIASIPLVEVLRYARLFHILRLFWVMSSHDNILSQTLKNRREATIAAIFSLIIALLTAGSTLVWIVEKNAPNSNIHTAGDALWWTLVTISTVGYGDHYPVTTSGKILASVIIICGVSIFGMISGLISSMINSPSLHKSKAFVKVQANLRKAEVSEQEQVQKIDKDQSQLEEKIDHLLTQQTLLIEKINKLERKNKSNK